MAIKVAIRHKTTYYYDRLVALSPHVFRLRPAVHSRTPIESYSFKLLPEEHFINWQQDPFGNFQARVVFPEKTTMLEVDVEIIARLEVINPFDFFVEEYAEKFPFSYTETLQKELVPYLEIMDNSEVLEQWIAQNIDAKTPKGIVDFLVEVNQKVNQAVNYTIRMEAGVQTPEHTLQSAWGSCRDSAWLLVQLLRHVGLAARFVSGYLVQLKADEKSLDGPSGTEVDFTDLHAWAEVYIPGAGWIGMDATSGLFAGEGHIPLACTPDYRSAAPVVGATDPCEVTFSFENTVTRLFEDPRVTKPFSEQQWLEINAIGEQVDRDLQAGDVRLTMGGEPTFVSIDDMESAQWNTAADGKEKRLLSHELIFRLRDQFGPQGLIQYGQGKWYPGEPLPRWQYALYWRKDGFPIWKNPALIAQEKDPHALTHADAQKFMDELARTLAVGTENISTAYEDSFFFLWTEGKSPANVDPFKADLRDPLERRTLAELLDKGLDTPAGYILPLEWSYYKNRWASAPWRLNRKALFLIPGNSPIGLRLPLDSLPEIAEAQASEKADRSPFEQLSDLPSFDQIIEERYGKNYPFERPPHAILTEDTDKEKEEKKEEKPAPRELLYEVPTIKTAISAEVRDGILYLFLPPLEYIEHYLDLIASIETTAEKLQIPVRIEGYKPPYDYRLENIVVSPDPGVIEVNIQPAQSWQDLRHNIETLYEQARLSRLGTEKFMVDGRHTGTGGGGHVTIGGDKPENSALLRRPDLLQSLITFWQHHPSLSYLFSGPFIGPTSQAPRIDEGREDRLYEMEIAFSEVPDRNTFTPFWLTDRIFRHLLTDITGNTHRSEFCIDKLYSPDSSSGRLGILEFRGFDMPPHKQMCLLQMLLIRALVAAFWKKPYKHDLARWGTELHDKFLLPHFAQADIEDVVEYLNAAGYPFKKEWFAPFLEFRFPRYGTLNLQDIQMDISMAIEPWHVLGEEMSSNGTARFVDSSLERVQVKLANFNNDRYILLCNGIRVPLTPTARKSEYVSGIRYRAWQPPSALHPTIGVDVPLTFDIVDIWNGRSIGGCTYYVSHPGGRSYDVFPINSYEAESRRISRFGTTEHTQGALFAQPDLTSSSEYRVDANRPVFVWDAPVPEVSNEFPCTLDLRKVRKK